MRASQTSVVFNRPAEGYEIPLHGMGGGIEQLLMVATVLLTTGDTSTLFIEEPESHLHAGAQRFLIEQLYQGDRQVFVTTHSPTFVNQSRPKSLYQVVRRDNKAEVTPVRGQDALGEVLEDIGARNSDLLLSDSVLFVEGPSDGDVLAAWADILQTSLTAHIPQLKMSSFTYCFDAQGQRGLALCRTCERDEGQLRDCGNR
ncbi:MAG: AAA family ATPase, partial [Chloroflexota bacterium]|nr:AAA family ATPase [Chloroflexota bacterium]